MAGQMWFGTLQKMLWVPAPRSDADMSAAAWSAGGQLLNGGGYERHSWGSHQQYVFEWGSSSSRYAAQLMQSFRDGSYGRGSLFFYNPNDYDMNLFPRRWADPSMTMGYEGTSLVSGVEPDGVLTSGGDSNNLPVTSCYYNLDSISEGYRGDSETVFLPIPEGYTIHLGAFYAATGTGAVYATPVNLNGTLGTAVELTAVGNGDSEVLTESFDGIKGVRVWIGKGSAGSASVTLMAMMARIIKTGDPVPASFTQGPWVGGSGHSGCSFVGVPTKVVHSGVNGGQVAYAASFKEVGDWL